jgi:uncharacterized protein
LVQDIFIPALEGNMKLQWVKKHIPKFKKSDHKYLRRFGQAIHHPELWHLTRHSVAAGAAAGFLVAFIPLPIQTIGAITFAILFRGNVVIAIAITLISNPFTLIPINYFIYKVGQFITGNAAPFEGLEYFQFHDQDSLTGYFTQFVEWSKSLGKSILVGIPVVSICAALGSYLIINIFWKLIDSLFHLEKIRFKKK